MPPLYVSAKLATGFLLVPPPPPLLLPSRRRRRRRHRNLLPSPTANRTLHFRPLSSSSSPPPPPPPPPSSSSSYNPYLAVGVGFSIVEEIDASFVGHEHQVAGLALVKLIAKRDPGAWRQGKKVETMKKKERKKERKKSFERKRKRWETTQQSLPAFSASPCLFVSLSFLPSLRLRHSRTKAERADFQARAAHVDVGHGRRAAIRRAVLLRRRLRADCRGCQQEDHSQRHA